MLNTISHSPIFYFESRAVSFKFLTFTTLMAWLSPYTAVIVPFIFFLGCLHTASGNFSSLIAGSRLLFPCLLAAGSSLAGSILFGSGWSLFLTIFVMLPYLFFGMIFEGQLTTDDGIELLKVMVYLSLPCGLISLLQKVLHTNLRVFSTFSNPNYYAYILVLVVLITLGLFPHLDTPREKYIFALITVLNLVNLYNTGCRTGMLAMLLGALIYFFLTKKNVIAFTGTIFCTALLCWVYTHPDCIPRFAALEGNIVLRELHWKIALSAIKKSPVLGRGLLSFKWYAVKWNINALHSHNLFLNAWMDLGIPGLAALGWMGSIIAKRCFKGLSASRCSSILAALLAVLFATLIHGLTDVTMMGLQTSLILIMLMGISVVLTRDLSQT